MDPSDQDNLANCFKIRTITAFISERISKNPELIDSQLEPVVNFLRETQSVYEAKGYEVQTTRIATRLFQEDFENIDEVVFMATFLEKACIRQGISFLSLGSTGPVTSQTLLAPQFISGLASVLKITSFTVAWQPEWDYFEAKRLAEEIFCIAQLTNGEANFRFAVSFNCKPGIPYFPAAEAPSLPRSPGAAISDIEMNQAPAQPEQTESKCSNKDSITNNDAKTSTIPSLSFAIGTENSQLLYKAFSEAGSLAQSTIAHSGALLNTAQSQLETMLTTALQPVEYIAKEIEEANKNTFQYLGIDTSIAPGLEDGTTITAAFEKLELLIKNFGDTGTLAITERITRALQSIDILKTGYCGLMLPVCEDRGLAAAAENGRISIQSLLQYSAVCGVGLDTVPVAGPGPNTSAEEREELITQAAAVLLDVAALSQRLGGKQLSVRLLPVKGGAVGEKTRYTSPYLVDSAIMSLSK